MDILKAIEQFEEFKNSLGISRDKAIEIYNYFKLNPEVSEYCLFYNSAKMPIKYEQFWSYLNTSIIKELYSNKYKETGVLESVKYTKVVTSDDLFKNLPQDRQEVVEEIVDEETSKEYTKLRKEAITYKTKLNHERNSFNKKLKEISELEELNRELIEGLKKIEPITLVTHKVEFDVTVDNKNIGIIALSDLHFNELIDIASNKYDFSIASKRLKKLANVAKQTLYVNRIVILGLGDFINSDRRQSEVYNMSTNRNKATVIGFELLRQFILDLSSQFEITIAMISGNESRTVGEEFDTSDDIATYNYDYTLYNMLKIAFQNFNCIDFVDGSFGEKVLNINGSNVLITHGINIKSNNIQQSVSQTFGRYANIGIHLDYLFAGHYHNCNIGDIYSLSGSLCGGNSYSEGALNFTSRASQLIGVFYPDKTNSIIKVDLQNTDNIEGYNISNLLEDMNAKSINHKYKPVIYTV